LRKSIVFVLEKHLFEKIKAFKWIYAVLAIPVPDNAEKALNKLFCALKYRTLRLLLNLLYFNSFTNKIMFPIKQDINI